MRLLPVTAVVASLIPGFYAQAPPGDFGQPDGVDLWCGRTYRPEHPEVRLGGEFKEPPLSEDPLFRLHARSRMNIYLDTDEEASLLVDATIVHQGGEPLSKCFWPKDGKRSNPIGLEISYNGNVLKSTEVDMDSADNEIYFSLEGFEAQFDAHQLTVKVTLGRNTTFTDSAELLYLPYPEDYGSVSRLDDLYGGLYVQRGKDNPWEVIFPYTFYAQWTRYWNEDEGAAEGRPNISTLEEFTAKGYNVIHPVPTGSLGFDPIPWDEWLPYVEHANELGLWFRYDVNLNYDKGLENTRDQVEGMKRQPSLLLWYHSDEPDGKTWPLEPMREGYDMIKKLDPYHPVSLVLNCYDWHYAGYSNATDIVASDVYPIGINATFSIYGTVCNETYGVCGCDMCEGSFKDIYSHMDEFARRDEILRADKVQWFTPQAFGNETHWDRIPTGDELAVMTVLAINHGAKGIVQWDYPSYPDMMATTERLAKVLPTDEVAGFFLGAPLTKMLPVSGADEIDAAAWVDPKTGDILVSVINMSYKAQAVPISVSLPEGVEAAAVDTVFWGERSWAVDGDSVTIEGLSGLEVSIFSLKAAS